MKLKDYWDELDNREIIMTEYIRGEYDEGLDTEEEHEEYD